MPRATETRAQRNPQNWSEVPGEVPLCRAEEVAATAGRVATNQPAWQAIPQRERAARLIA